MKKISLKLREIQKDVPVLKTGAKGKTPGKTPAITPAKTPGKTEEKSEQQQDVPVRPAAKPSQNTSPSNTTVPLGEIKLSKEKRSED